MVEEQERRGADQTDTLYNAIRRDCSINKQVIFSRNTKQVKYMVDTRDALESEYHIQNGNEVYYETPKRIK